MTKVFIYLNSDYVSARPRVVLGAPRAASGEQSEIPTSAGTLKQNHERLVDGKYTPNRNVGNSLSPSASQSPGPDSLCAAASQAQTSRLA